MIFIVIILASIIALMALVLYSCVVAGKRTDIAMRNWDYQLSIKDIGSVETEEGRDA